MKEKTQRKTPIVPAGFCLAGFCVILFFSCDILRDSPFEVEGWTPGEGYHPADGILEVSLLLSHDSDRVKTEQAFSFDGGDDRVTGNFSWEGRRLFFRPAAPLEENRDYRISLGTGAQDTRGLSLEQTFEVFFTTRLNQERPKVLSIVPAYNGIISGPWETVGIEFSEPVTVNSCVDHISFRPAVSGVWRLGGNGKTAGFAPSSPWESGSLYELTIASGFQNAAGRSLGEEFSSVFRVAINDDAERPFLLKAWALDPGKEPVELAVSDPLNPDMGVYGGWESFTRFRLDFSEPVDTGSVGSKLETEPSLSLAMEEPPGFSDSVTFSLVDIPEWQSCFNFILNSGVTDRAGNKSVEKKFIRIRADGAYSKPPLLVGMRLPMAPGKEDEAGQEPAVFSLNDVFKGLPMNGGEDDDDEFRFPSNTPVPVWIELYFETAPDTGVNPFSVMELFRVEATNNALSFSPRSVHDSDFTWADPAAEFAEYQRLEIRGYMTNKINSGVIGFQIDAGLEDLVGNKSGGAFCISLLK